MNTYLKKYTIISAILSLGLQFAEGHISYTSRDFSAFQPDMEAKSVTISNQAVTGSYGWADGTDADFGDAHRTRAFRFTLGNAGYVTITTSASGNGGTKLDNLLPAFSVYQGLAHLAPAALDHDTSNISLAYLLGQGLGKEGVFVALDHWKVGNDTSVADTAGNYNFSELSSFTYIGNAVDGTSTNYGSASGINGDGLADGTVTSRFFAPGAGEYTLMIGGALYAGQTAGVQGGPDAGSYGFTTTVSVIPEPTSGLLLGLGGLVIALRRRRI
jgi:hypothetical protein